MIEYDLSSVTFDTLSFPESCHQPQCSSSNQDSTTIMMTSLSPPTTSNTASSSWWTSTNGSTPIASGIFLPATLDRCLKPHQHEGIRFMFERILIEDGTGCVLAHSMGLGKSVQVISMLYLSLQYYPNKLNKVLLVAPKSTLHTWGHEFTTWGERAGARPIPYEIITGASTQESSRHIMRWKQSTSAGVLIVSPETLVSLIVGGGEFENLSVADLIVVDEAHKVRNSTSQFATVLARFPSTRVKKVFLTGWPLQNNLMEYLTMVEGACPGIMHGHEDLKRRIERMSSGAVDTSTRAEVEREETILEFQSVVARVVHRRTNEVLKNVLPPLHEHVLHFNPSSAQMQLYDALYKHQRDDFQLFSSHALSCRIANHPDVLYYAAHSKRPPHTCPSDDIDVADDDSTTSSLLSGVPWVDVFQRMKYVPGTVEDSAKMLAMCSIVHAACQKQEKVLIFSQSIGTLDVAQQYLAKKLGWGLDKFVRIDGGCSTTSRVQSIADFNRTDSTVRVAFISTKAGGLGLTLTAATRVILFDVSWNPCHDGQAIHRAYRIGQTKPVHVYRFIITNTMEETVFNLQRNKMYLFFTVVDGVKKSKAMTSQKGRIDRQLLERLALSPKDINQHNNSNNNSLQKLDSDDIIGMLAANARVQLVKVDVGHDSTAWDKDVSQVRQKRPRREIEVL